MRRNVRFEKAAKAASSGGLAGASTTAISSSGKEAAIWSFTWALKRRTNKPLISSGP
jgi:hypothetical protein